MSSLEKELSPSANSQIEAPSNGKEALHLNRPPSKTLAP